MCNSANNFSVASMTFFQEAFSRIKSRKDSLSHVFHKASSCRAQVDKVWAWHLREELYFMLLSQAESHTGCPWGIKDYIFKLTLSSTRNELKVAIKTSKTPEQFLCYDCTAIHTCKQMGTNAIFSETEKAVESTKLNSEIPKMENAQSHTRIRRSTWAPRGRIKVLNLRLLKPP